MVANNMNDGFVLFFLRVWQLYYPILIILFYVGKISVIIYVILLLRKLVKEVKKISGSLENSCNNKNS
jgi:hypothetical protein